MKKLFSILSVCAMMVLLMSNSGCESKPKKASTDQLISQKTEMAMAEANREIGLPAIANFQEKKNLKWIYELCDQEDFICHAYLFNEMKGEVGQYLGECIGYGIPYSTQFSNPEKMVHGSYAGGSGASYGATFTKQAEPNGLFKPEGLSATWLIMVDPNTKKPRPVYVEPSIVVSPFKLH